MRSSILPIFALLTSAAFLLSGNGLQGLLLPIRGQIEGFSPVSIGLIGTGWAIGFVAGCLLAPRLVKRVGHIRCFAALAAAAAIIALISSVFVHPIAWIILRGLSGFALSGSFMIIESWLNERSTNATRGTIFAFYMTVNFSAMTMGQLSVALGDPSTTLLFMCAAILFCLAIIPTSLSTATAPRPLTEVSLKIRALYENSPVSVLTVLLVGVANGAFGTLVAVYGGAIGLTSSTVAYMMSIAMVSGALLQFPAGRISDKTDRRFVIIAVSLLACLAGLAIAIVRPQNAPIVLLMFAVYGGFAYPIYSLAVAHANDHAAGNSFVSVSGGLLLIYGIGTMVGPLAAGSAMEAYGSPALFYVTASAQVLIALYTFYRLRKRAPVSRDQRENFAIIPSPRGITPETPSLSPQAAEGDTSDNDFPADPQSPHETKSREGDQAPSA